MIPTKQQIKAQHYEDLWNVDDNGKLTFLRTIGNYLKELMKNKAEFHSENGRPDVRSATQQLYHQPRRTPHRAHAHKRY